MQHIPFSLQQPNTYLTLFTGSLNGYSIPERFTLMSANTPHPLCLQAAKALQVYLQTQQDWKHNFGLTVTGEGSVIGKMFGVLIVQTASNEVGYLCAFSGKLGGTNTLPKFVPPIFDALAEDGFLAPGMLKISQMNATIKQLETEQSKGYETAIKHLKAARKTHSNTLQRKLFDHYFCINQNGVQKSIFSIYKDANYKNPPAGAAECATPKLLQYAFLNHLKPLAIAEFWWGQSPKSDYWKHREFYPCCKEKCEPILTHMLSGMEYEFR